MHCISNHSDFFADNFPWMFLGFWIAISYLVSFLGGWQTLSKTYRFHAPYPKGIRWFGWHSGSIGLAGYRSCLWVGLHATGVFLRTGPLLLFRAGHPPLFIPWTAFEETKQHRFLFFKWSTLELAQSPSLVIYFWPWETRAVQKFRNANPQAPNL